MAPRPVGHGGDRSGEQVGDSQSKPPVGEGQPGAEPGGLRGGRTEVAQHFAPKQSVNDNSATFAGGIDALS